MLSYDDYCPDETREDETRPCRHCDGDGGTLDEDGFHRCILCDGSGEEPQILSLNPPPEPHPTEAELDVMAAWYAVERPDIFTNDWKVR